MNTDELLYFNEFGGFSRDGKEYNIKIKNGERTPAPWSHIMANEKFGTLVTSNGGGYTWYGNSRENKITTWSNDQISDTPSESIYIKGEKGFYTAFVGGGVLDDPIASSTYHANRKKNDFNITYGFGYAIYETTYEDVKQELTIFVPKDLPEKISILKLSNESQAKKKLKIYYCIEPVLGVARKYTKKHLLFKKEINGISVSNNYSDCYSDYTTYISSSERIVKATCEKDYFSFDNGIEKEVYGVCRNPYVTLEIEIEIAPRSEKIIYFSLGENVRVDFTDIPAELEKVKDYWKNILNVIQVKTPVESMNIMMNGWLIYQTIVSRLWGRTSFYQCGGAFGFRDQLQDVLSLLYVRPDLARKQILYHAAHQFVEGDVLHWWHPEKNNGIRSRYKDDLLWLPFVVYDYIEVTGDKSVLDMEVPYIEGRLLNDDEEEIYGDTQVSKNVESIYMHCIKAIEIGLQFGEHGLPQMGGGDWNDGMNKVCGESVWLGFFLYDVLNKFTRICEQRDDMELKEKYKQEMNNLEIALNQNAWDGKWYRRAYFKDGTALGSSKNDECRIDSISQSWSVISGAGSVEKMKLAMDSLENYLVDKENLIIKLLTPPFSEGDLEPGYIKAYIPGVRENGGQYTHGACSCGQFLKY